MKLIISLLLILLINIKFINCKENYLNNCQCSNTKLCNPLEIEARKEFVGYSLYNDTFPYYDWSILTTIAIFYSDPSPQLLCDAHSNNVRVTYGVSYPIEQLDNSTYREEWINQQLEMVESTYYDGLNFDVESPITNETLALLYTQLVSDTNDAFKKVNPYYQITVDVAWSPNCIDKRCYDYLGLSKASDFLIAMDYDERSQIYGQCTASANSPPQNALEGFKNFTKLGISVDKLGMGLPWYAYSYPCIGENQGLDTVVCQIEHIPFRGVNCSDAAGTQINYGIVMDMLQNSSIQKSTLNWSHTLLSPWFNYIDPSTNQLHQMWFDNPESLLIKVNLARKINLRAVAVWNIDFLNNQNKSQSLDMWNSLGSFFSK